MSLSSCLCFPIRKDEISDTDSSSSSESESDTDSSDDEDTEDDVGNETLVGDAGIPREVSPSFSDSHLHLDAEERENAPKILHRKVASASHSSPLVISTESSVNTDHVTMHPDYVNPKDTKQDTWDNPNEKANLPHGSHDEDWTAAKPKSDSHGNGGLRNGHRDSIEDPVNSENSSLSFEDEESWDEEEDEMKPQASVHLTRNGPVIKTKGGLVYGLCMEWA